MKGLLAVCAVVCLALAVARVWCQLTPKSIMQRARVGLALFNLGADGAVVTLGPPTALTPTVIDAILDFDRECPIKGIIIKIRRIEGLAVELVEKLEDVVLLSVHDVTSVDPRFLTAMPAKQKLQRLVFYDCDLTGRDFPPELGVYRLRLETCEGSLVGRIVSLNRIQCAARSQRLWALAR